MKELGGQHPGWIGLLSAYNELSPTQIPDEEGCAIMAQTRVQVP